MLLLFSRAAPASRRSKPLLSAKAALLIAPKLMQVRRCFSLSERALAKQLKPEIQGCLINKCTMPGGNGNGGRNELCGQSSTSMPIFQAQVCAGGARLPQLCARSAPQGQQQTAHISTLVPRLFGVAHYYHPVTFFMEPILFFTLEYCSSGGAQETYQGVTYWVTV